MKGHDATAFAFGYAFSEAAEGVIVSAVFVGWDGGGGYENTVIEPRGVSFRDGFKGVLVEKADSDCTELAGCWIVGIDG